jgi:hypothetical protein
VTLHRGDNLLGLGSLDPHIVGTLGDQQRPHDAVGAIERRALLEELQPGRGRVIAGPNLPQRFPCNPIFGDLARAGARTRRGRGDRKSQK